MTDSKKSRLWVAVVAGLAVFGAATWLSQSKAPEALEGATEGMTETGMQSESQARPNASDSAIRIAEHGRLHLIQSELPSQGSLTVVLGLPDDARGATPRRARIVSTDGRRIDTTASALAGTGTGVAIEIDPAFLTPGLYMIEIETAETKPLPLRRYVIEVE